ncbi:hypothetical protein LTR10_023466 [Elasticomyces elasticus]|uniref:Zn(2)-C6 fungal-type domain-containing protein n=1 Tax=Exophiala sideris TaxID=1016849 RepID=A0ABR0IWN7_9EURO|nr:hypothetical protein LTR10_023466 [Elasticomyces elasticus]KAK5021874.1 hypothetical protein LTS07_010615 [Exophiala sideris]KAK5025939.1 hypothetical protein LTR13_010252 [Exophiala sideris]KAK5050304.1 hypothetical protein LTR69_010639 [Exophiala sideris]KAK5177091.1 hypothetical protein LTR44_010375 [Eurotiomycetes sp. CCFEE 6388]
MDTPPSKRKSPAYDDRGPPSKKIKTLSAEEPAQYSDAVRKKLAATSRTGQACDRCKERKMKCDTDPIACQPCRQKGLRCFTTDRVTGHARERGETDRAENELQYLKEQLAAYQIRYGPLQHFDTNGTVPPKVKDPMAVPLGFPAASIPEARYVGWPAPENSAPLCSGPVKGTVVDILDGTIDIADWDSEMMQDYPKDTVNRFNLSRTSIINTITGFQQVEDPKAPPREEALRDANHFLIIMSQYVPVVHRPTFMEVVHKFYDQPASMTAPERVQLFVVFAIIAHQSAVRNHYQSAEKFEDSHRYLHYALGFYRDLWHDKSIASMQAMALIIVHFRNLPKPGISWNYTHKVLVRAIELEYHRDPDKIELPEGEDDPLSKELRKRVFHSILAVCVTTGCRVGLPAPWQFQHIDLPLPKPIRDSEISKQGISSDLSGLCDFWPCLQLAKLLPLLTELHNHIIAVRKPAAEYLQTVDALNTKIMAWRQDWDESIKYESKDVNLHVATLLIETWAAEYQLNLYHPVCCASDDPEVMDRHLDICHKASKRLLQAFHTLSSRYKGVDFTWHSTLAYATGFGITLYVYGRKKGPMTLEQFEAMRNELKGWMSLMAYADLVLRTGNHLQGLFHQRVQSLVEEYRRLLIDSKPPSLQIPFVPVNGSSITQHDLENQNALQYQENGHLPDRRNSLPPPMFIPGGPMPAQSPSQLSPGTYQPPQWSPLSFAFLPQPQGQIQVSSPTFPAYSNSITALPTPGPVQGVPTSLASLLNESGGSIYANYPTPPHSQNGVNGVNGINGVNRVNGAESFMSFQPNHYFDGPGPLTWPLISMPPGGQPGSHE